MGKRKAKRACAAVLGMTLLLTGVAGCKQTDGGTQTAGDAEKTGGSGSSVFDGTLEENVTIRVLENDTAISKGYFKNLIEAFNEAYADYGIVAVDANMDQDLDLANDGPYGYGPDVLYQANDVIMQYVEGKHITAVFRSTCRHRCFTTVPICCRRTGRKPGMRMAIRCRIWRNTGTICTHFPWSGTRKIRRSMVT